MMEGREAVGTTMVQRGSKMTALAPFCRITRESSPSPPGRKLLGEVWLECALLHFDKSTRTMAYVLSTHHGSELSSFHKTRVCQHHQHKRKQPIPQVCFCRVSQRPLTWGV